MQQRAISKNLFDPARTSAAMAAALDTAVEEADNPASGDWANAIKTHGGGVRVRVAEVRDALRDLVKKAA